ncbi:MAG: hypothetical protein K2M76_06295, partial [Muribaculaceae bacterium]|nr:hypothetical protein [Muribaculaceae bacterium]
MDLIEAIKDRKSVRTFSSRPMTEADRQSLLRAIAGAESPFGGDVTIALADFPENGPFKPSTYGVITGAVDYLMMWLGDDDASWMSGGYKMEQVVLRATQLGLGTCWIAATFKG